MKKIKYIMMSLLSVGLVLSCETTELDELLDNPNLLPPENIDVNDGLNGLQFAANGMFRSVEAVSGDLMRLSYMFGTTYQNATGPGAGGGAWTNAYANILQDSETLLLNAEQFDASFQIGMIRVLRGYALMTLVDFWGDVPFAEANLGVENFNPALTDGATVYEAAFNELELGIAQLELVDPMDEQGALPSGLPVNLLFDGAPNNFPGTLAPYWLRFAKTLQFKYHLNLGNTAELQALINEGNLIDSNDESVVFRYSTATEPASRNPIYNVEYGDDTPGDYISNYMMAFMLEGNILDDTFPRDGVSPYGITDPRLPYYVYRQSLEYPGLTDIPSTGDAIPCFDDPSPYPPSVPFCGTDGGYWGRDHGNSDGIPPDNNLRATYGAYPVGGLVDTGDGGGVSDEDGLNGAGITPILMAWQVDFLRAEAALTLGTGEDARALVQSGLEKSLSYVLTFDGSGQEDTSAYEAAVLARYDGSEVSDLQVVAEQLWLSSFLSAVEPYNQYRRTGFPQDLQPHLQLSGAGAFPRSLFYVGNTANLNLSVAQKPDLNQSVFWADPTIPLN